MTSKKKENKNKKGSQTKEATKQVKQRETGKSMEAVYTILRVKEFISDHSVQIKPTKPSIKSSICEFDKKELYK